MFAGDTFFGTVFVEFIFTGTRRIGGSIGLDSAGQANSAARAILARVLARLAYFILASIVIESVFTIACRSIDSCDVRTGLTVFLGSGTRIALIIAGFTFCIVGVIK